MSAAKYMHVTNHGILGCLTNLLWNSMQLAPSTCIMSVSFSIDVSVIVRSPSWGFVEVYLLTTWMHIACISSAKWKHLFRVLYF